MGEIDISQVSWSPLLSQSPVMGLTNLRSTSQKQGGSFLVLILGHRPTLWGGDAESLGTGPSCLHSYPQHLPLLSYLDEIQIT